MPPKQRLEFLLKLAFSFRIFPTNQSYSQFLLRIAVMGDSRYPDLDDLELEAVGFKR